MEKQISDIEILEMVLGGVMIKEMSAVTFFGWMAGRLNGVAISNDPKLAELRMAVANPPLMPRVADETKIKYVRNLIALGIISI